MSRTICITSADGQTGHLVAELLLEQFSTEFKQLCCLALNPDKCEDLKRLGAQVIPHKPKDRDGLVHALKSTGADTIFLIPPAHKNKLSLAKEMIDATYEAGIKNTVLLSAAGADLAEEKKQHQLRQFIHIEAEAMKLRYLPDTEAGTSQCIIRAGFYAENLLLCDKDVKKNSKLRLPIGDTHSFAPIALGDIAKAAASVLVSQGPHGLDDKFRGQLVVLTGPMMVNGPELAAVASEAGLNIGFSDISENEAKQILEDTDVDAAELQYLLEYYSLVREGKTNYVSTLAFTPITGELPTLPLEFFHQYDATFKPKKRRLRE
ncbi:NAD(P)-binding protein [Leucogyrophana mollusca]|uniref:NAD(P)-binding protein n=1 Tax=Leucogyrophana mollusca TaxID=85980 RepID=A0ACB8BMH2_9AGAM|nr:NAD(P)-binding protein [Leucogyrophana mollusca]